ncbi:MAG: inner membrane CreD family protein, partial [Candidatus Competibacteraceae bacterium]|nr:inner membrane CreD family protein [Candidatus Competibacteraceae bacterium]
LTARMSFFGPVCLAFFFVLIGSIAILKKIPIHPMHYLFVTAGFFAFNLLFAYLVDWLDVHLAFALAAAVSVGLVVSYLRSALGPAFPWKIAAAGQLFYLVLFSYSFFLQGMTGLTVTIGAVLTLAVLMRLTARLDWREVFKRPPKAQ